MSLPRESGQIGVVGESDGVWTRQVIRFTRAILAFLSIIGLVRPAFAWEFPIHAEFSRTALQDSAPSYVVSAIESAMRDGNSQGLRLCPGATIAFNSIDLERDSIARCISYGALTALAGDHAKDVIELRDSLGLRTSRPWPGNDVEIARQITGIAVNNWKDVLVNLPTEEAQVWTGPLVKTAADPGIGRKTERRYSVADLDLELTVIDREYLSRAMGSKAHFQNATQSVYQILRELLNGDIDNALAQTLVHHARSLQLAMASSGATSEQERIALRAEALLEHVFAVHFLEDGFAAGHLAVDASYCESFSQKERHDYFNRQGLEMTRALEKQRCPFEIDFNKEDRRNLPVPRCWVGHGDGFATMADRWIVGEAVARLQTVFALALIEPQVPADPSDCQLSADLESLFDEQDKVEWLLDPRLLDQTSSEPISAYRKLISCALRELERIPVAPVRQAGTIRSQVFSSDSQWLGCPLKQDEGRDPACEKRHTQLLWRPLLVDWPTSTAGIDTLEGSDGIGGGFSYQMTVRAGLGCNGWFVCRDAAFATVTGTGGLGLNVTGIFPRRRQYSLLELNGGIFVSPRVGNDVPSHLTSGVIMEVRAPITTLILMGAAFFWRSGLPMSAVDYRYRIGVFGGRGFLDINSKGLKWRGWDVEFVDIRLSAANERISSSRSNSTDTELRMYLGCETLSPPMKKVFDGSFTIKAEIIGGYYGYF